jgi:hypothetical protein
MEKYIIAIFALVLLIVLGVSLRKLRNSTQKPKTGESGVLRKPFIYSYIGVLGITIFTLIGVYALLMNFEVVHRYTGTEWVAAIIFLLMDLPFIYMILLRANWKIEIEEKAFTYRNVFGKKKVYAYSNVETMAGRINKYYYNGKLIVGVSHFVENWNDLEKAIKKRKRNNIKNEREIKNINERRKYDENMFCTRQNKKIKIDQYVEYEEYVLRKVKSFWASHRDFFEKNDLKVTTKLEWFRNTLNGIRKSGEKFSDKRLEFEDGSGYICAIACYISPKDTDVEKNNEAWEKVWEKTDEAWENDDAWKQNGACEGNDDIRGKNDVINLFIKIGSLRRKPWRFGLEYIKINNLGDILWLCLNKYEDIAVEGYAAELEDFNESLKNI